ncbi:hypothetical protein [Paramicrobacterium chengjingii]|uniref:MFS transporter n=1 Tax=Paramicrobacterium chengjingii TaxID=2769067 RepID=A0ABX6YJG7_9MICO|nr:hypothetical protein [Microbacterium chengjingii]QPZ38964.1 hypothetical protein HCR76_02355 [Microbacterium chengjingii]
MPDPTADFDPRFDPRFQPGFDPEVHSDRTRASRQSTNEARASTDAHDEVPIVDAEDLAHGGALDENDPQDAAAAPPRGGVALLLRNPFIWVIVVLAAALIAWSLTSYASAIETTSDIFSGTFGSDEETKAEYASAQFAIGIAPFTLAVGILALAGVAFFAAATWWRKRDARR